MARIPYRGKDHNVVSVGPSLAYDSTTVQGALDLIENTPPNGAPSSTNPYLVTVAPGVYAEEVEVKSAHNYCTLRGECKFGSIIRPATGVGVWIANSATYFALENINVCSADEQAVLLGTSATAPSASLTWDEIDISDCVLDAQQNALRISGTTDASGDDPPRLRLSRNLCRAHVMAFDIDGNARVSSVANVYRCSDTGDSAWLATLSGTVDIKVAARFTGDTGTPNTLSYCDMTADVIEVNGAQDVGGTIAKRRCCGVYLFTNHWGRMQLTGVRIRVEYSDPAGVISSDRLAGVSSATATPEDGFIMTGGSIEVVQRTGAAAAPDMYGIGSTGGTSFLKMYGTSIVLSDEVGTSNLYSLFADSGCTIEGEAYSDEVTGGAGTFRDDIAAGFIKP